MTPDADSVTINTFIPCKLPQRLSYDGNSVTCGSDTTIREVHMAGDDSKNNISLGV